VELKDGLAEFISWIREKGPCPFDYHLPVELPGPHVPKTWSERLM
jgi:hypothetical protein